MTSPQFPQLPPIPGYEPIRLLGINLCAVYLARHSPTGTLVALKVCRRDLAPHFLGLHAPLVRIDHPNISRLVGIGEFEQYFYCALEYLEKTLADRLLQGPLPEAEVARISQRVCSALQYAWDQGMIVVDLTPNAVLLDQENVPRLTDFHPVHALAGSHAFTPPSPFMAPEQLLQQVITPATDVYRVGALMYAMLTGAPPFPADAGIEIALQVLRTDPKSPRQLNPTLGRALDAVCMTCLAKRPDARYASLQHLSDNLKPFLRESSSS